jgi:asparagine N-glycosylation enzyme membrane subunit Stt3
MTTKNEELVSPSTRKSRKLFWAKELLGAAAILTLAVGALSTGQPSAIILHGPLPVWVAAVAIPSWLLARALREVWRSSSDEHERRASDFGRNAAAGVFLAVTPAWWVAARAGLAPHPDAMALWILILLVSSIGWAWRRYN